MPDATQNPQVDNRALAEQAYVRLTQRKSLLPLPYYGAEKQE
ncbi:MAG: hypothetical protein WC840_01790 [Candidatus Peribacteraceae bacterium]